MRRKTGMTSGEVRGAFKLPSLQSAQSVLNKLTEKGLVERDYETRRVNGPSGRYDRLTTIYKPTDEAIGGQLP